MSATKHKHDAWKSSQAAPTVQNLNAARKVQDRIFYWHIHL